jgi:uncharacterized damage-inducible protein DinB
VRFPSPTDPQPNRAEVLLGYLDYFRSVVLDKLDGLSEADLRSSRLPSGWAPLELLKHLIYVERRWLVWGFLGQDIGDPWADSRDDRWWVGAEETPAGLTRGLSDQAAVTRSIVEGHNLAEVGQPGERWDGAQPATLERILLHLVQEYARHAGHLDIVRELLDGRVGE